MFHAMPGTPPVVAKVVWPFGGSVIAAGITCSVEPVTATFVPFESDER